MHFTAYLPRIEHEVTVITNSPQFVTFHATSSNGSSPNGSSSSSGADSQPPSPSQKKSLSMCFTSTGAALSLPPKKKDIYRPYSLEDRPTNTRRIPAEEDLHAAHAILDLSASTAFLPPPSSSSVSSSNGGNHSNVDSVQNENKNNTNIISGSNSNTVSVFKTGPTKTVAYTYEAFFVSDGRSKRKSNPESLISPTGSVSSVTSLESKTKYTCTECGKQYATSSNLSRHKQTHRSLDSQSAKKCNVCGKAYVSMPALAMHILTHKLSHKCDVCGKLFSRPWLLQGHKRSHSGEKPFGCAHCGKAFADRSNLRAHMQTHSSDKNFECQRCHKTFALKSYLNKHLESACFKEDGLCENNNLLKGSVTALLSPGLLAHNSGAIQIAVNYTG